MASELICVTATWGGVGIKGETGERGILTFELCRSVSRQANRRQGSRRQARPLVSMEGNRI
jgi:hypothetical protein